MPDFIQCAVSFTLYLAGFLFRHPTFDLCKRLRYCTGEPDWSFRETKPDLKRGTTEEEAHRVQGC